MSTDSKDLTRPPTPDWWEQQTFQIGRREASLGAEELWLSQEQTVRFPARCQQRQLDYQNQEAELIRQSQARLQRAFGGNMLWVLRGSKAGRPALTRTQEGVTLDREIAALRRTFHQLHERDAQWIERTASVLSLKRSQLETDKQTLRNYAAKFGVVLTIW
jgi:hypothetical protein